jgi:hypothetical protein
VRRLGGFEKFEGRQGEGETGRRGDKEKGRLGDSSETVLKKSFAYHKTVLHHIPKISYIFAASKFLLQEV